MKTRKQMSNKNLLSEFKPSFTITDVEDVWESADYDETLKTIFHMDVMEPVHFTANIVQNTVSERSEKNLLEI